MEKINKFYPSTRKGKPNVYPVDITRYEIYAHYKKSNKYKKFKTKYSGNTELIVDRKTYSAIINDMFEMITNRILDEGINLKLPCSLGYIGIKKRKMNFAALEQYKTFKVDMKASQLHNRLVYHLNEHSNNYSYRWYWDKSGCKLPNKKIYKFSANLQNKRKLAQKILTKERDYTEDNRLDIYKKFIPRDASS